MLANLMNLTSCGLLVDSVKFTEVIKTYRKQCFEITVAWKNRINNAVCHNA
jgi:hypothetical protein